MQIFTTIENFDGRYRATVATQAFTANEINLIQQFGEPTVDTGGTFSGNVTRPGGSPVAVSFTLPNAIRRIQSDFPASQVFDLADTDTSDMRTKLWADTVASRISDAKTALLAKVSPFVGETLVTI